jgi:hypothetical protein
MNEMISAEISELDVISIEYANDPEVTSIFKFNNGIDTVSKNRKNWMYDIKRQKNSRD